MSKKKDLEWIAYVQKVREDVRNQAIDKAIDRLLFCLDNGEILTEAIVKSELQSLKTAHGALNRMKTEWISVKDRLPKFGVPVLCFYTPRAPVMEGQIIGILKRQDTLDISSGMLKLFDENGFALAAKVTHWMPLPPKP